MNISMVGGHSDALGQVSFGAIGVFAYRITVPRIN
jgi:hypothetical protein